uniref:Uncharacterized protein n=1 Tax=Oryza punctata TaxID=4537 RepID=A0A0E0JM76_ORYPU
MPDYLRHPGVALRIDANGGCCHNKDGEASDSAIGHEACGGAAVQRRATPGRAASRNMQAEQRMTAADRTTSSSVSQRVGEVVRLLVRHRADIASHRRSRQSHELVGHACSSKEDWARRQGLGMTSTGRLPRKRGGRR